MCVVGKFSRVAGVGCIMGRPYHDNSTAYRLLGEVKHSRDQLVLRWGTRMEIMSDVLFVASNVNGHGYTMERYCTW